jgi:hypothetical protein
VKSGGVLLGVFVFALTAHAQPGLIAHYQLNGNAFDSAGANNGNVVGAVGTSDRFGQVNSAMDFNGSTSRIEFSGAPPLTQLDNWTLAAWLKPADLFQTSIAVYVGRDNGISSDGFGFGLKGNAFLQGFFSAEGGYIHSGQAFPGPNQWCHVAMVRTNGVLSFYFNATKTPQLNTPAVSGPTDFTIGSQNGLRFFHGAIDDVRIYDRALSDEEVRIVFAGRDGPCYPHAAAAFANVVNGFVVGATLSDLDAATPIHRRSRFWEAAVPMLSQVPLSATEALHPSRF